MSNFSSRVSCDRHVPGQGARPAAWVSCVPARLGALVVAVQAGVPLLLWGPPGGGKSKVLTAVADSLGWPIEVVIGAVHDAADFAGLPVRTGEGVRLEPPAWARRLVDAVADAPGALLCLDELTTAAPLVQAAMLQVVLERRVGELVLPSQVRVVAAANPVETAAGGCLLTAPLANRFVHLRWELSGREIAEGFVMGWPVPPPQDLPAGWENGIDVWRARVGGFLLHRPELAHSVPERLEDQGGPWPSPRTWEMVARLGAACDAVGDTGELFPVLATGCVGEGAAAEVVEWLSRAELPDPEQLLGDPQGTSLPNRGDLVYATLGALVAAVERDPSRERWEAAWKVLERISKCGVDLVVVAAARLLQLRQADWELPEALDVFAPAFSAVGAEV